MSYPRYPAYKDSGIEWLGELPAHWNIRRLKYLSDYISRGDSPDYVDESGIRVLNQACIQDEGLALDKVRYTAERSIDSFKGKLKPSDVLINSTGTGTLGRVGIFDVADPGNIIVDSHVTIVRTAADLFAPKYLYYFLKTRQDWIMSYASDGATNQIELNREKLRRIVLSLPPLAEQRTIAAFLDRETAGIDSLIEKEQQLIALLQEKRQAIISHTVTRGVRDDDVVLKDSGVEWLGMVPEHWEVYRNRRLFQEIIDLSEQGDEELLTVSHLTGVTPRSEKNINMIMAETLEGYKRCQAGDTVINTMWAWMGALGIARQDGVVSPSYNVYRVRPEMKDKVDPSYFDLLYRIDRHVVEINRYSKGIWSSRLRLYPQSFFEMSLPVPPLAEQQAIVTYLDQETARINTLIAKAQQSIALLTEHRTALIAAAVTGKIDVRGAGESERL